MTPPSELTPLYPCREEVLNVVHFIRDRLMAAGLTHVVDQVDENPDCWTTACHDKHGHANFGMVGWSDEKGVIYVVYDQTRENHDLAEGVGAEDSKCWWMPRTSEQFVMAMEGEVRRIMSDFRAAQLAEIDREHREAA